MDLLTARSIYSSEPPDFQSRDDINPTFLVSWWCTIFSVTIILIRLFGRWIRTEKLFLEDKIMFWSMVPLLIRMGFVHVVLIFGTNNTVTSDLTHEEILRREIGSRLVLAARIFYAAFIWIAKLTVLEFLKRTIGASWARSYEIGLRMIYAFLALTFVAVIISTLSECQPFSHYWLVVPDPGAHCRQGLVQLITMGACDIVTDIVLIAFPIPVVIASRSMTALKKLSLVSLFLLSLILIAITSYRVPSTIHRRSSQPYRSLIASLEILAATCVANVVIIGSFIRDKGIKKAKFRANSIADDDALSRAPTRSKSIALHHWGSDEDLFRDVGVTVPAKLRRGAHENAKPRPAPMAPPGRQDAANAGWTDSEGGPTWNLQRGSSTRARHRRRNSDSSLSSSSTDIKLRDLKEQLDDPVAPEGPLDLKDRQMSFFDVGGLVDKPSTSPTTNSRESSIREAPASNDRAGVGSKAFLADMGGSPSGPREEDEADEGNSQSRSASTGRTAQRTRFGSSPRLSKITETPPLPKLMATSTNEANKAAPPDALSFSDAGGLLKP
ncbi:hypothetical protein DV737_g5341, partial [Chaetothyriales sp. CBS 132003]